MKKEFVSIMKNGSPSKIAPASPPKERCIRTFAAMCNAGSLNRFPES
jgi:hypothetical protein